MALGFTLNSRIWHVSGHSFKVVHISEDGNDAIIQAEADQLFGVVHEDAAAADGWDVYRDAGNDYVEFAELDNALKWLETKDEAKAGHWWERTNNPAPDLPDIRAKR